MLFLAFVSLLARTVAIRFVLPHRNRTIPSRVLIHESGEMDMSTPVVRLLPNNVTNNIVFPINISDGYSLRQIHSISASTLELTDFEFEVIRAFEPEHHSIDSLALSVGDRVKVTYDPWKEHQMAFENDQEHFVFGIDQNSGVSGWLPISHTRRIGGSALIQSSQSQVCRNTFFADWGSSGMKLVKVHIGDAGGAPIKGSEKLESLSLTGNTTTDLFAREIEGKCEQLANEGNFEPNAWRIYATAGLRLHIKNAKSLWRHLRKHMSTAKPCGPLLADCRMHNHRGCRTLPGAVQALYEMSAYFTNGHPLNEHTQGWISAGDASLQIGFFGPPSHELRICLAYVNKVWADDHIMGAPLYDKFPGMVAYEGVTSVRAQSAVSGRLPNGKLVFLFSFLSVAGDRSSCDSSGSCDHRVGGVNEMRKQFEAFLIAENEKQHSYEADNPYTWLYRSNPCLEARPPWGYALFPLSYGSDFFSSKLQGGLVDDLSKVVGGGFGLVDDMYACNRAVDDFLLSDKSLQAWRQGGCYDSVKPIELWGMMTSFARSTQMLGKGVRLQTDLCNEHNWNKRYACGQALTSTLLMRLLILLGWDQEDEIDPAQDVDWASTAMRLHGLKEGWCPHSPNV